MGDKSAIEWTDATWNPVTGCTEVSTGCDHCYAKTFAERFRGVPGHPYEQGFDLKLWPERVTLPLRWKKPRRIFVNSMSDLFHKDVPDAFIHDVFRVMHQADRHVYQVLTKRPRRMARFFAQYAGDLPAHIWLGTSIESDTYIWRADYLRKVPAAIRFISAEPLLSGLPSLNLEGISWLIVGGESGHGARPMHPGWARGLRDQAQAAGVAYFFKQWGEWGPVGHGWSQSDDIPNRMHHWVAPDGSFCNAFGPLGMTRMARIGKHAAGRLLDGRTHDDYPV